VRTRSAVAAVVAALAGLALTACSSNEFVNEKLPDASAFRAGACTAAADNTLALGRFTRRTRALDKLTDADRAELKQRQSGLAELRPTLEPDLRDPMEQLIIAVGFVRIRADSNTYRPTLLSDVDKARRTVQTVCVHS
jgi:hypothetical protein